MGGAGTHEGETRGAPVDAAAMVLAGFLRGLQADAGFVASLAADGATVEVARVTERAATPVRLTFPADAPYPLAAALRESTARYISSNDDLECNHPGLVRMRGDDHACATVPLYDPDRELIGALNVSYEDPRDFTDEDRTLIELLSHRCAAALLAARNA